MKRARKGAAAWIRSAPGTYVYLFALLVTSWSLRNADPRLAAALLRSQSTNLDNLTDRPLQVLVASAFWTGGQAVPWRLMLYLTLILAPVERRLGTGRTIGIFAAGHVLATLLVAAGLQYGMHHGILDVNLGSVSDVGVSYGLLAVAGALTWLLEPLPVRLGWILLLLAASAEGAGSGLSFTDVGHYLSLLIGLGTAPLVRRWQRDSAPQAAGATRAVRAGQPVRPLIALPGGRTGRPASNGSTPR